MGYEVVVENLDLALAGERGVVDLGRVVGTEKRMGGLAYDAVKGLGG